MSCRLTTAKDPDIDYAMLVKIYGASSDSTKAATSPANARALLDANRGQARPEAYFNELHRTRQPDQNALRHRPRPRSRRRPRLGRTFGRPLRSALEIGNVGWTSIDLN